MLTFIVLVLAFALFLYMLLGGADFGAGILEIFTGSEGKHTISEAIAPVWEANHVWLVLVVVILFMGFPEIYTTISLNLHIPLLIVLIGIILRGTAFTFRHYDVREDVTHNYYTVTFRFASVVAPLFLGIILGAMILGRIHPEASTFTARFINPWLNLFSISIGIFSTALFAYLAAVYLIGEAGAETEQQRYIHYTRNSLISAMMSGFLVFICAEIDATNLAVRFIHSPLSLICMAAATLIILWIWYAINHRQIMLLRVLVAAQIGMILVGWFAIQFPVIIRLNQGESLTIYNTHAPAATLLQLGIALIVGIIIIFPAFFYLFKVFKFE